MRIGICAGHSRKSPGATGGGLRERDVCREIVDFSSPLFRACGHEVFDPHSDATDLAYPAYLLHRINYFNRHDLDLAIDVHLNAWEHPEVNYSLVAYGEDRLDSVDVARSVADSFTSLPWPAKGATQDAQLGRTLAFCRRIACPAMVVEPLFLSNPTAREWLSDEKGRERLAVLIVEGVEAWVKFPNGVEMPDAAV